MSALGQAIERLTEHLFRWRYGSLREESTRWAAMARALDRSPRSALRKVLFSTSRSGDRKVVCRWICLMESPWPLLSRAAG